MYYPSTGNILSRINLQIYQFNRATLKLRASSATIQPHGGSGWGL